MLLPCLGAFVAWAAFEWSATLADGPSKEWIHAVSALWILPATVLLGVICAAAGVYRRESCRALALTALVLNALPTAFMVWCLIAD